MLNNPYSKSAKHQREEKPQNKSYDQIRPARPYIDLSQNFIIINIKCYSCMQFHQTSRSYWTALLSKINSNDMLQIHT